MWARYPAGLPFKDTTDEVQYITDRDTQTPSLEENERVFRRAFDRTLAELASPGRQIVIILATPEVQFDIPKTAARAIILDRDVELRPSVGDYTQRQAFVNQIFAENKDRYNLVFIRPHEEMCEKEYCPVLKGGMPIYFQGTHIATTYSLTFSHLFDPFFAGLTPEKKPPPHADRGQMQRP